MAKPAKSKAKAKAKKTARAKLRPRKAPKAKAARRPAAKRPAPRTKPAAVKPRLGKGSGRMVFYGSTNSMPAGKVALMLALSGAPHSYRFIDLAQGAQRQPDYLALNRYGQVPVLRHGDITLAQSNVILRYLADALGKFSGRNEGERRQIETWLDWEADMMSSGVRAIRAAVRFLNADAAVRQYIRGRAERALNMLNAALAERRFLVADRPTIADIAVLPHLTVAEEGELDLAPFDNVRAWVGRMMSLPGARHPYDLMPREDRD
jgi:glutathione S-transferase